MSFLLALTQKLNQCHHKDRKAVLHHFGLPSHSPGLHSSHAVYRWTPFAAAYQSNPTQTWS